MARLSAELGDAPHEIKPLLWSGANSIFERDRTAQVLAECLSAEHAEHPLASQLIIAHSHGGNIALRALHHLQMRNDFRLYGADSAHPFVATLATPFIEIHQADFGPRPLFIRFAVLFVMWFLSVVLAFGLLFSIMWFLPPRLLPSNGAPIIWTIMTVVSLVWAVVGWWWIDRKTTTRHDALEAIPCDKVDKVGNHYKIDGPITVDGKTYKVHVITDQDLIEVIASRCPS